MQYADIIVDITAHALDRPFQYHIPQELQGRLEEGSLVEIPFGRGNRTMTGYVVGFSDSPAIEPERIKDLQAPVTGASDEEKRLIGLAVWIRDRYGSTMLQALRTVLPAQKRVKAREKRIVKLAVSRESAVQQADVFRIKNQKARWRLLSALAQEGELPYEVCTEKLPVTASVIRALVQKGWITVERARVYRNPVLPEAFSHPQAELNPEQQAIADAIVSRWDTKPDGRYLIRGVTGSGKTEVYIELIAEAVRRGRQAIVLIPEISLTYQTLMRFYHRFGGRVSVIHSKMTAGERSDQFERAKSGDLDVMIGPRSALFTPFANLGIIVIDEEHEESYRSSQAPRYHAREVAFRRAAMEGAKVVLGSATPSLDAEYAARRGALELFRLDHRANEHRLPETRIIDMRDETGSGNTSVLSDELQEEMGRRLARQEQIMLFLNRRGYAGFVSCRSCGTVIKCPHCDVSLSLHGTDRLVCHYCGFQMPMVKKCPECGSPYIRTFHAGTEQIQEQVEKLFPQARILRMDRDTTAGKDSQLKILSAFASHEADILIGTQMIVKGHDFPNVTLVGILLADLSLNIPDYRAAERTFQLLTQAAGRAGRADKPGLVLIQTYEPDHYAIRCAAAQDYDRFFEKEMEYRSLCGYPPAGSLTAIHMSCADKAHLDMAASYVRRFLDKILGKTQAQILGPAQEGVAKIADVWKEVIYLKNASPDLLRAARNRLECYIAANEGFSSVDIQFDVDR